MNDFSLKAASQDIGTKSSMLFLGQNDCHDVDNVKTCSVPKHPIGCSVSFCNMVQGWSSHCARDAALENECGHSALRALRMEYYLFRIGDQQIVSLWSSHSDWAMSKGHVFIGNLSGELRI